MDVEIVKEWEPLWVKVLEEKYEVDNMQPTTTQTISGSI